MDDSEKEPTNTYRVRGHITITREIDQLIKACSGNQAIKNVLNVHEYESVLDAHLRAVAIDHNVNNE